MFAAATGNWLETLTAWVATLQSAVWGMPLIVTILATGILLTVLIRIKHLTNLGKAFRYMLHDEEGSEGEVSSFGALCTALSATIGTGNIVGVATAIGIGGPGALFWMEVAAFFGMATKYAEGLLAVKYRTFTPDGRVLGGPFYYIERGLGPKWKPLAILFAVFGIGAGLLGIGTITQVHGITSATQHFFDPHFNPLDPTTGVPLFGLTYSMPVIVIGMFVTICTALVIIGGLKRISSVSTIVVPFMAIFYIGICTIILLANITELWPALKLIVKAAFNPAAYTGGAVGSIFLAMQSGIARGIFSNEAGLGSAPIAAAAAKSNEAARQGLVCMMGTFITIIVCTMTGLTIVLTDAWDPALKLEGVDITIEACTRGLSFVGGGAGVLGSLFLMIALSFFAFTTILGWNYYSERCLEYLIGPNHPMVIKAFRVIYVLFVAVGPYLTVSVVWNLSDAMNGLMAFPNLVALIILSPVVARVTLDYFRRLKSGEIKD